jgi:hypothetical protein
MSKNSRTSAVGNQTAARNVAARSGNDPRRPGDSLPTTRQGAKRRADGRLLTIRELGWTREEAAKVRAQLASFAVDWDDPAMDVYNEP